MRKIVSIFAAALAGVAFAGPAQAQEPFQVHLEAGAVVPLDKDLSSVYSPGPSVALSALWTVHPNISVGPGLNGFYLPKTTNSETSVPATLWQAGPVVRFQADRKSTDWVFSHVNPWLDVSPMIVATGNLVRPALNVGVGAEGPLDIHRIFWLGPFVRYTHVFAVDGEHVDANLLQGGFSFSFDLPIKIPTVVVREQIPVVRKVVVHEKEIILQHVAVCPTTYSERVYFDANSSTLRWESKDKLDEIATKLNHDPGIEIKVSGNASSDGPLALNNKLSAARTKAVVDYLVKHGVPSKRLVPESEGVTHPAASNKIKEGRERNRRVEFNVVFAPAVCPHKGFPPAK